MAADKIGSQRLASGHFIAGVVGFGAARPAALAAACPFVRVEMPLLRPGPSYEVWASETPPAWSDRGGAEVARAGASLFGVVTIDPADDDDLESLARRGYETIFRAADGGGCPHVLRAFNYLPRITAPDRGTDRYRCFNAGRHAAFVAAGRTMQAAPAASALGTLGGLPVLYFLASDAPGHPIENPRQTSAYRYPPRYGAQSPSFSRAMLSSADLFVSGTASIVGHESLHMGDAAAQVSEICRNLDAILERSGGRSLADVASAALAKIYVRRPRDVDAIMDRLAPLHFGQMMIVQAEVCRGDLLLEIEMFVGS